MLIRSKISGQKLEVASRHSIEFEASSDRSLPLAVNNELQVSVRLRYSAMDDLHGVFAACKGLGGAQPFENVGPKSISSHS